MTTDAGVRGLVAGLGIPGPEYAANRHNVGFMVADLLAERIGARFKPHGKAQAQVVEGRIGPPGPAGRRVILAKPMSFMNVSGWSGDGAAGLLQGSGRQHSRRCTTSWTSTTACCG
ncbi:Peptidyl-tRNA hydrolase [Streptomyces tendae]